MRAVRILHHTFYLSLLFVVLLNASADAYGQWAVPEALQSQADGLNNAQLEFITSGDILEFIPERQLEHELQTRNIESLRIFVDDLMSFAARMRYNPEQDMGAAPLNLTARTFERGGIPTPIPLREFKRESGPFSVHRYLFPRSGIPTFGGAKVAIFAEDLVAGDVDVAIVGVPSNLSSGRRDASFGPHYMRALNTIATPDVQSLINPLEALSVVDYGTFRVDNMSAERSVAHVAMMISETAATGAIPMLVGGDTSTLYPAVKGIADNRGAKTFGLLHFSAHPDVNGSDDHTASDRRAIFNLLDRGILDGSDTIQVGLRGPDVDVSTLTWLREQGVRYHTMAEFEQRGFDRVFRRILREVDRGADAFFVSVDVSVIDPADMVAAGRVTPKGVGIEQVTRTIRQVCASKNIVGFEITDMAPMLDVSRLSVLHANAVLNACLNGIAVRKSGLDADYVHPLALDHGRR